MNYLSPSPQHIYKLKHAREVRQRPEIECKKWGQNRVYCELFKRRW